MRNEIIRRFLEPYTPEKTQSMLVILAAAIQEALELLPDTEENRFGIAVLKSGPILALYKKNKAHMSLDKFLEELLSEPEHKKPADS